MSARSKEQNNTDYLPIQEHGLEAIIENEGGNGSVKHPFGGSVTSIANPHIQPMSNNLVDELNYYVVHTNDTYIKDRMMDTIGWECQTYNTFDKEYDHGKKSL